MDILVDWALKPLSLIACAFILTLFTWCIVGAKPRLPFLLFCFSMLMFFSFSMSSLANALVARFEHSRQNPIECQDHQQAPLIVLGGGIDHYVPNDSPYEILKADSLIRILRAPEFATPQTHYYLLGGGPQKRKVAAAMQQVLVDLNIDSNNITIETASTSTRENAQALLAILPPTENPTIRLLTSMLHVPRASASFEKVGYSVCHIGVDSLYSTPTPLVGLLPFLSGLNKSTLVSREWMALTLYRIKGYI